MDKDELYMNEALKEAEIALKEGDWPIGCVIVLDDIIARAHNEVYSSCNRLAHAEMLALDKVQGVLNENPNKATLYTTYEPCPMCLGAIVLSRLNRVVYGVNLDNSGATHLKDNLPLLFKQDRYNLEITDGVLAKESYNLFMRGKPTKTLLKKGLLRTDIQF